MPELLLNYFLFDLRKELVYLFLQFDCLSNGCSHLAIMSRIFHLSSSPILQIFIHHPITANLILPDFGSHIFKIAMLVDVNRLLCFIIDRTFYDILTSLAPAFSAGLFDDLCLSKCNRYNSFPSFDISLNSS